jgi:DNA (cytosine-5)-methyltransferase 1
MDDIVACIPASQTKSKVKTLLADGRIRYLTPRECWLCQGFPGELYDRAARVCSETQLYKQSGNAVSVPIIEAIAKRL